MIVLDSSAVVEVLTASPKAAAVEAATEGERGHAPELIGFEVLSAIRGHVRGALMTPAEGLAAMLRFARVEARLELWPLLEDMAQRAIQLRENVTAYDACYVSLAEMMPCALVTADARLARAVDDLIEVIVV